MRIVVRETSNIGDVNPCGTYSYGETEDYKIFVYDPLSINESDLANINVYPNPNEGTFTVDLRKLNTTNDVNVELYTISGQLIHQSKALKPLFEINTNEKSGVYFLRLTSGTQVMTKKVIISN
ncbi:MAG TPA: T9SS type A sorting domain-containing protein [Lutibacter sp.]|nr:T9SS type A sorting domain-containing protein [Lutibacter sp.]